MRSTTACSATFRRDLLLQLLNRYQTLSAVTAVQAAAQLAVARPIFMSSVMNTYLSIDPSVRFFAWPAISSCCWLRLLYRGCCTSAYHIKT